jgi:hypothetical protein
MALPWPRRSEIARLDPAAIPRFACSKETVMTNGTARPAFDFLAQRRSHPAKAFLLPVPDRAALLPILQAALRVPDHGKLEPWRLMVLTANAMPRLAVLAETHARNISADDEKIAKGRGMYDLSLIHI